MRDHASLGCFSFRKRNILHAPFQEMAAFVKTSFVPEGIL